MKVRPAVVWFVDPIQVGGNKPPQTRLEFDAKIPDSAEDVKHKVDQLLGSLHDPDKLDEPHRDMMQGVVNAITQLHATLQQAPPPGTRLLHGWVEFTTATGQLLLLPHERIAWVELGAESERLG